MPIFHYEALSESGSVITGESLSSSKEELARELRSHGYRVQNISHYRAWTMPWKRTSISKTEFFLFVNELLSLLKAGLPVVEALELTSERHGEQTLEKIVINVQQAVRAGSTLSEAFSLYKDKLDELFVSVLKTGEQSGDLPSALEQYLIYLASRIKLHKKLKQAMAYPLFLLVSLLLILGIMFFFVMPRFASMYENFGAKLPAPTQALIDIASNIPAVVTVIAILISGVAIVHGSFKSNLIYRERIERIKMSLPLIGPMYELRTIAQVSHSLAILLLSGTPLVDSLKHIRESSPSIVFSHKILNAEESILGGASFANAVDQSALMPKTAVKLIRAGEASGNLGAMILQVADYYHDMLDTKLERIMTIIEPLFIMIMGLVVGAVIIIMYLPIFKLAEVV